MPTKISWAAETLNVIVALTATCPCGWIGPPSVLDSTETSSHRCPGCGVTGTMEFRRGWHCERVSPGCGSGCASPEYAELVLIGTRDRENQGGCYAESLNESMRWNRGTGLPYNRTARDKVDIILDEDILTRPLRWKKPRSIFWTSMSDWDAEFVKDEWRDKMLAVMALTPQHRHLLLTKRAEGLPVYLGDSRASSTRLLVGEQARPLSNWKVDLLRHDADDPFAWWPPKNIWLGFSAENQKCFDERWDAMAPLAAAGWNIWCSFEPLLGPIDAQRALESRCLHCGMTSVARAAETAAGGIPTPCFHQRLEPSISYSVIGGESGTGYRALELEWLTNLANQCKAAGVQTHVKQDSGPRPGGQGRIPDDLWALKAIAGEVRTDLGIG